MNRKITYLDYAAATPMDEQVVEAMEPYFSYKFYNPSATYLAAKSVRSDIDDARSKVAYWLGARPSEIFFTAGGTEANNLAIGGVMEKNQGQQLIISAIEHDSVRNVAEDYNSKKVRVDNKGMVDETALKEAITDKTVLVSIIYASNEIGTVQDIKKIATLLQFLKKQRRARNNKVPLYFHIDAAQAANYLDLHVSRLGVDLMTINGGKIYGPKQSGVLYVKSGIELGSLIKGGGQEHGLRSGTENVPQIIGLTKALDIAQKMRKEESARLAKIQNFFIKELQTKIPSTIINGGLKNRLPNNLSVTFPSLDNERLMMQLDQAGIICAVGSACSASTDEPSHVLKAIGLSDEDAQSTLRFSMGRTTTKSDIAQVIKKLKELVK